MNSDYLQDEEFLKAMQALHQGEKIDPKKFTLDEITELSAIMRPSSEIDRSTITPITPRRK